MSVAGRVMPLPKGSWDADTEYTVLDIVGHKGSSFIAKRTSIGVEPVDGAYWQKLVGIQLDTELSETSENGLQNKVVAEAISQLNDDLAEKANSADLANVATSGSYNDLSNKPTIPTVNNGTLTVQKNGSNVATFTANQSGNATANISVPEGAISDAYSASTTYSVGQYCLYNNSLWKCKTQCKGQTPAENSYWTKKSLGQEINQINSDLSAKVQKPSNGTYTFQISYGTDLDSSGRLFSNPIYLPAKPSSASVISLKAMDGTNIPLDYKDNVFISNPNQLQVYCKTSGASGFNMINGKCVMAEISINF